MSKRVEFLSASCPAPVIGIKKEIDANTTGIVEIVLDNIPARENVLRFLKNQGKEVQEILEDGKIITIIANFGGESSAPVESLKESLKESSLAGVTYIINSEIMGVGHETLGKKLLIGFLNNLPECKPLPQAMFFFNSGVNLCLEDSPTLDSLKKMESEGVEIFVCGTCTNFFEVTDKIGVGVLGNLFDLTTLYQRDKVVTI